MSNTTKLSVDVRNNKDSAIVVGLTAKRISDGVTVFSRKLGIEPHKGMTQFYSEGEYISEITVD